MWTLSLKPDWGHIWYIIRPYIGRYIFEHACVIINHTCNFNWTYTWIRKFSNNRLSEWGFKHSKREKYLFWRVKLRSYLLKAHHFISHLRKIASLTSYHPFPLTVFPHHVPSVDAPPPSAFLTPRLAADSPGDFRTPARGEPSLAAPNLSRLLLTHLHLSPVCSSQLLFIFFLFTLVPTLLPSYTLLSPSFPSLLSYLFFSFSHSSPA